MQKKETTSTDYKDYIALVRREAALTALMEVLKAAEDDNSTNLTEKNAIYEAVINTYNDTYK